MPWRLLANMRNSRQLLPTTSCELAMVPLGMVKRETFVSPGKDNFQAKSRGSGRLWEACVRVLAIPEACDIVTKLARLLGTFES